MTEASANGKPSGKSRSRATALARKQLIAQAVIDILAREGARSLTHRRIDAHIGLPQGGTSYYYPRWFDLLKAGFNRLYDLGVEEYLSCYKPVTDRIDAGEKIDVDLVAASASRHWMAITRRSRRDLAIARFEFYLLATHDPKLLSVENDRRRSLFEVGVKIFTCLGSRNPERAMAEFRRRAQGDYMSHFIAPSFSQTTLTAADFASRIQSLVEADDGGYFGRVLSSDQPALVLI